MKLHVLPFIGKLIFVLTLSASAFAGGKEYSGQFEQALVANTEDDEQVVFKSITADKVKGLTTISTKAHLAAARILDPRTQKYSVLALFVEERGENPTLFVDVDGNDSLTEEEKFVLKPTDNPYLWETTAHLKMSEGFFKTCPIFLRYFKSFTVEKMGPDDRLFMQSISAMARGKVDVEGKTVTVQYSYDDKKVDHKSGYLGLDMDSDGEVDMGKMSPESTKARDEAVVFRFGTTYLSTKKADVSKNQIVLVEREAKDYKRLEIYMNKEFPDFSFTDFEGKKHKFSEFRGKYILLDIWGFWCGPCRRELPYIREANRRFQSRNLVVIGLNTDEDFTVDSMKKGLADNGMTWTQAQFTSVATFLRDGLRVNSYPTTFLISPEGKVLSIGRTDRDEPDLRGKDLLESLDKVLPAV